MGFQKSQNEQPKYRAIATAYKATNRLLHGIHAWQLGLRVKKLAIVGRVK
jgi:hypothetical protein